MCSASKCQFMYTSSDCVAVDSSVRHQCGFTKTTLLTIWRFLGLCTCNGRQRVASPRMHHCISYELGSRVHAPVFFQKGYCHNRFTSKRLMSLAQGLHNLAPVHPVPAAAPTWHGLRPGTSEQAPFSQALCSMGTDGMGGTAFATCC